MIALSYRVERRSDRQPRRRGLVRRKHTRAEPPSATGNSLLAVTKGRKSRELGWSVQPVWPVGRPRVVRPARGRLKESAAAGSPSDGSHDDGKQRARGRSRRSGQGRRMAGTCRGCPAGRSGERIVFGTAPSSIRRRRGHARRNAAQHLTRPKPMVLAGRCAGEPGPVCDVFDPATAR